MNGQSRWVSVSTFTIIKPEINEPTTLCVCLCVYELEYTYKKGAVNRCKHKTTYTRRIFHLHGENISQANIIP